MATADGLDPTVIVEVEFVDPLMTVIVLPFRLATYILFVTGLMAMA
jgi:hypothetical protein